MDLELNNKAAIITGGTEGIGKATATVLTQEGANVLICGRRTNILNKAIEEIRQTAKGKIEGINADITKKSDITLLADTCIKKFSRIDILINNAGTSSAHNFELANEQIWDEDLQLKLYAALRLSHKVITHMKKNGAGRIINVTNLGGKQPGANSLPTSVSRAAGMALTKAMSKDLAKYNILVNTVAIGLIKSGQHEKRFDSIKKQNPALTLNDYYQSISNNVPLNRVGEASEAANAIAFLVSGKASYLTGTAINIDGGTSAVL